MAPLSPSVNLLVFFFVISRDRSSKIVRGNPLRRSMEMITYREPSCKSPYKGAQFMNVGTFWCCLLASLPRPPHSRDIQVSWALATGSGRGGERDKGCGLGDGDSIEERALVDTPGIFQMLEREASMRSRTV